MRAVPFRLLASGLALLALLGACIPPKEGLDPRFEVAERLPGLVPIRHDSFALAFLRPGADLGTYRAVRIDPIQVEYLEGGAYRGRSPSERTTEKLASEFREAFAEELASDDGYPIVDEPGPGVLDIRLWIVNVEVARMDAFFPETSRLDNSGDYQASMTLVIELVDSQTDLVLFWARDRRAAPLGLRGSDRASILSRGRVLGARWAGKLREGLGGPRSGANGGAKRPAPAP